MYDTVFLKLSQEQVGSLAHLPARLSRYTFFKRDDSSEGLTGKLGRMDIAAGHWGVSIKGSLCKYYLGDNIRTLTRQDTVRAVEKLSDELGLPVAEAKVNRLDLAQNIVMDHRPKDYYPLLGRYPRFSRLEQPDSIYYQNRRCTLQFYDKIKEAKKERIPIPLMVQGINILRYEMRLTQKTADQLGVPLLTSGMLGQEATYVKAIDHWHQNYQRIHKQPHKKLTLMDMNIKTPKDFLDQLALVTILEYGEEQVIQLIDELKRAGNFGSKEYASRLKQQIREKLKKAYREGFTNDLLVELDKKVAQATMNYR